MASQSVLGSPSCSPARADCRAPIARAYVSAWPHDDFRAEFAVRGLGPATPSPSTRLRRCCSHGPASPTPAAGPRHSDILESATLLSVRSTTTARMRTRLDSDPRRLARAAHRSRLVSCRRRDGLGMPLGKQDGELACGVRQSTSMAAESDRPTTAPRSLSRRPGQSHVDLSPRRPSRLDHRRRSALRDEENTLDQTRCLTALARSSSATAWRLRRRAIHRHATGLRLALISARRHRRPPRSDGSDSILTWRGGAHGVPSPAHVVEFGAQAQSLRRHSRNLLFTDQHDHAVNADSTPGQCGLGTLSMDAERAFSSPGRPLRTLGLIDQSPASPCSSPNRVRPDARANWTACRPGADLEAGAVQIRQSQLVPSDRRVSNRPRQQLGRRSAYRGPCHRPTRVEA